MSTIIIDRISDSPGITIDLGDHPKRDVVEQKVLSKSDLFECGNYGVWYAPLSAEEHVRKLAGKLQIPVSEQEQEPATDIEQILAQLQREVDALKKESAIADKELQRLERQLQEN